MLAARPGFFKSCELWRKLNCPDENFMTDIYEGKFWKDWADYLKIKGNLLLMLNVDWFRPYKHTTYSIGVIYLVILNLPRTLRFRLNEPKLTINTYLKPLVDELLQLYTGIYIALACISSDIPATRKVCGFYGFNARHGCSKCMKEFPTESVLGPTNYSGFQREKWPLRDIETHRSKALEAKSGKSGVAR